MSSRQTKKSTWDVGRSMRYNQDAQRSEGTVVCKKNKKTGFMLLLSYYDEKKKDIL